jgi:hypothetical protein
MDRAARVVPGGFGGVIFVRDTSVILLRDTSKTREAIAALNGFPGLPSIGQMVSVRQARWTYSELQDWFSYLVPRASTGVTAIGIDLVANCVVIGAKDKAARKALVDELSALPIPRDLVALRIQSYATPQG